jgi:hypothetical protein
MLLLGILKITFPKISNFLYTTFNQKFHEDSIYMETLSTEKIQKARITLVFELKDLRKNILILVTNSRFV